jgi:transcriptional regulator with XRE-family HTH domain
LETAVSASPNDAALVGLAQEYLELVAATQGGHGDPDDRPHAASYRAVVHDQILQVLGLTRDDPFDAVAWAQTTVSAARRAPATDNPYADLPFEANQPLERYRLHHGMRLADFAAFLGITEDDYLRLVAGDRHLPAAAARQIADRLGTPPWLINEIAPLPTEEELARVQAAIRDAEEHGYYVEDPDTGEVSGPIQLDPGPPQPPCAPTPHGHMLLADALAKLIMVHPDGASPDYARLRTYLETHIRAALGIGLNEHFDAEAWADELLEGAISWMRQRQRDE